MDREKLRNERFLRICFIDNELLVDVNNDIWEKILNQRERIVKIESSEWTWNLLTDEIVFY